MRPTSKLSQFVSDHPFIDRLGLDDTCDFDDYLVANI